MNGYIYRVTINTKQWKTQFKNVKKHSLRNSKLPCPLYAPLNRYHLMVVQPSYKIFIPPSYKFSTWPRFQIIETEYIFYHIRVRLRTISGSSAAAETRYWAERCDQDRLCFKYALRSCVQKSQEIINNGLPFSVSEDDVDEEEPAQFLKNSDTSMLSVSCLILI